MDGYKPNKFLLSVDFQRRDSTAGGYKPNKFLLSVDVELFEIIGIGL